MQISEQGLALIKRFEGFADCPYLCPAGKSTIGYGHVIKAGEAFKKPITPKQAESLLKQDVGISEQAVSRLVAVTLNQNQFDALVSLAYNIGIKAFETSTLLRCLNNGDYKAAGEQFPRWAYAKGRRLEGLARRREAEKRMFIL